MTGNWRKWLIVAVVLVATHAASAAFYAHRYASHRIWTPARPMTLDLTFDQWAAAASGADSTTYLQVAENVAAGKGVVSTIPKTNPPATKPFMFWGPGAPLAFGCWLWLFGGRTMFTFFAFSVVAQLVAGALAVATAALWTRSTVALSLVAICSGFCPPLQTFFYGVHLTSSEIVTLPILALLFFVLNKAFLAWREPREPNVGASDEYSRIKTFCRKLLPVGIVPRVWFWFAIAGVLIGCASLSRDCERVIGPFVAVFLVSRAVVFDRRRLAAAIAIAIVVLTGEHAMRLPVQIWNKLRGGRSTICIASEGCIWRYGLWVKHDAEDWYQSAGLGFGEYLDPDAAIRVNDYYLAGKPNGDSYSMVQFAKAVLRRPLDAIEFKAVRLPVLWLSADIWPRTKLTFISVWCIGMYGLLGAFCLVQLVRRRTIPEVLYLYVLLIFAASALIHFEFRYTFPIWNTLIMAPGLLYATLVPSCWRVTQPARLDLAASSRSRFIGCSTPASDEPIENVDAVPKPLAA